jgi:putative DNA primase/helicase
MERHPTEIADLAGRRLVVSSEMDEGRRMRVDFIKQATGDTTLKARRMREDFWEFQRQFKLLLVTNNLPRVREESHAIWRRIKVVPFEVTIPDHRQDRMLVAKLRDEWPGILAWAVRGCLDWQKNGLCFADAINRSSLAYRQQEDLLEQFLEDCCEMGEHPTHSVTRRGIRKAYGIWAKDVDERATLSRNAFYKRLRERPGVEEFRSSEVRGFVGVRLARPADFLNNEERKAEQEFVSHVQRANTPSIVQVLSQIAISGSGVAPTAGGNSPVVTPDPTPTAGDSAGDAGS